MYTCLDFTYLCFIVKNCSYSSTRLEINISNQRDCDFGVPWAEQGKRCPVRHPLGDRGTPLKRALESHVYSNFGPYITKGTV